MSALTPGAARLTAVLANRTVLAVFLPAAYPNPPASITAFAAAADNGADVLEVGWPCERPRLDGATIRYAYQRTLQRGARAQHILQVIEHAASAAAPVVVMSYWEAVAAHGPETFAQQLAEAGAAGCMIPDLPDAEAARWSEATRHAGLHNPQFAARTITRARLKQMSVEASGWIYTPASQGLTGHQGPIDLFSLRRAAQRLRRATAIPIVTGVGVSTPILAQTIAPLVNGVVVGTPLVRLLDGPADHVPEDIGRLTAAFAAAVRSAGDSHQHRPRFRFGRPLSTRRP